MRSPLLRPGRVLGISAVVLALMLSNVAAVTAGQSDTVDPGLMTPSLNPSFTWECWRAGDQIICDGERTTTYTAAEAIPCEDGWIYSTGVAQDTLRRVGDSEGRALYTMGKTRIDDQYSRSPEFGGIIGRARGSWTDYYEYRIPGDLSSRIVTRHGVDVIFTVPGHGMVVLDAGIWAFDVEGNVLFAHGPHDLLDDFEGAAARACDALAGSSG